MPLTDKEIVALKPRDKKFKVSDADGLYILVHPRGGKYWYMKYHFNGRAAEVSIGTYPAVGLKLARERRDEVKQQLARGLNPQQEKRARRDARGVLFRDVAEEWLKMMATPAGSKSGANGYGHADTTPPPAEVARTDYASTKATRAALDPETVKKHRWILDSYLFPDLGTSPISQINSQHLLPVLKKIEDEGKRETAHRVRSLTSRIFCYAHATGRAPQGDITWSLRDALAPTIVEHHPSITNPDQVGELLLDIESYTGKPLTLCALKLAPLTVLRPFELRFGEWTEVNFEKAEWRIPKERMKMDSPHIVPLSQQALAVLYDLKKISGEGRYLFPVLGSKEGVMSENTVNKALRTMGYSGDVMTGHGFRSLVSTLLSEQQCWHPDAIERQLAHAPRNKIRAAYNYAEYLPERRRMMQALADYFDELRASAARRREKAPLSKTHATAPTAATVQ
jgi:integrase